MASSAVAEPEAAEGREAAEVAPPSVRRAIRATARAFELGFDELLPARGLA